MRYKQIIQKKYTWFNKSGSKQTEEEQEEDGGYDNEQDEIGHIYHTFLEHVIILLER